MDDRTFWLTVRRALLMVADAIAKRYGLESNQRPGKNDHRGDSVRIAA